MPDPTETTETPAPAEVPTTPTAPEVTEVPATPEAPAAPTPEPEPAPAPAEPQPVATPVDPPPLVLDPTPPPAAEPAFSLGSLIPTMPEGFTQLPTSRSGPVVLFNRHTKVLLVCSKAAEGGYFIDAVLDFRCVSLFRAALALEAYGTATHVEPIIQTALTNLVSKLS